MPDERKTQDRHEIVAREEVLVAARLLHGAYEKARRIEEMQREYARDLQVAKDCLRVASDLRYGGEVWWKQFLDEQNFASEHFDAHSLQVWFRDYQGRGLPPPPKEVE